MVFVHETPNSSNVAKAEYDDQARTLTVHYKSGGTYEYQGVPPEKWNGLRGAASAGGFIHDHIKPHHTPRRH